MDRKKTFSVRIQVFFFLEVKPFSPGTNLHIYKSHCDAQLALADCTTLMDS